MFSPSSKILIRNFRNSVFTKLRLEIRPHCLRLVLIVNINSKILNLLNILHKQKWIINRFYIFPQSFRMIKKSTKTVRYMVSFGIMLGIAMLRSISFTYFDDRLRKERWGLNKKKSFLRKKVFVTIIHSENLLWLEIIEAICNLLR